MRNDLAQTIALQAVSYLLNDEELTQQFLAISGATPESLRDHIAKSDTLLAALDFLLQDDQTLLGFCDAYQLTTEQVWRGYHALNSTAP